MLVERKRLFVAALEQNIGQIEGLPKNPREWTEEDVVRLAKSITETPELLDARPLLVTPHGDKYVILAGNLRYDAAVQLNKATVPALILKDLTVDKMKEIVLKDNGVFGAWEANKLREDWKEFDFAELGITVEDVEDFSTKNKELDIDGMDEAITLRLKYKEPTASLVKMRLGEDMKETLLKLLNYDED